MIFLIIILMFVPFCVLLAYLYAYVLFGVLNLSKKLSVKISFLVFYAIFILLILYFGFGAELFLAVPVMILSILILKRKQYFINFTKLKLAIASACLLVYAWQLEVPQKVVVNLLSVKLEIVDTNFTYLENPIKNFGRKDNLKFEYIEMKEFLNFAYTRNNIYACDEIDCKGNKKYIGYVVTPWSQRSTLMCFMNTAGRCLGTVSKDYNAKEEILKYIKRGKNE